MGWLIVRGFLQSAQGRVFADLRLTWKIASRSSISTLIQTPRLVLRQVPISLSTHSLMALPNSSLPSRHGASNISAARGLILSVRVQYQPHFVWYAGPPGFHGIPILGSASQTTARFNLERLADDRRSTTEIHDRDPRQTKQPPDFTASEL
jgi:hypothetical protein